MIFSQVLSFVSVQVHLMYVYVYVLYLRHTPVIKSVIAGFESYRKDREILQMISHVLRQQFYLFFFRLLYIFKFFFIYKKCIEN